MSVVDKEGFRKVIVGLSGLSDGAVVWTLDPQPFVSDTDRARVVLQLFSISALGWDEYRREYGPAGYPANAYVTTTIGNREVVITMRVEAFDKSVEAAEILDAIYVGMQTVDSDIALDAIKMAFVEASGATCVDYQVDERVVNAAFRDYTFGAINEKVVKVEIDEGWISTVDGNNAVPGTLTE